MSSTIFVARLQHRRSGSAGHRLGLELSARADVTDLDCVCCAMGTRCDELESGADVVRSRAGCNEQRSALAALTIAENPPSQSTTVHFFLNELPTAPIWLADGAATLRNRRQKVAPRFIACCRRHWLSIRSCLPAGRNCERSAGLWGKTPCTGKVNLSTAMTTAPRYFVAQ